MDESLSMAFLVVLERLTPVERAVFLLREVFEYQYAEIADFLGLSEVNCRQILGRAKGHVSEVRPKFETSERKRDDLLERFLMATSSGDMEGLLALLATDVVLHTDGGGKGLLRRTLSMGRGMWCVVRWGLNKLLPKNLEYRVTDINGEAGVVSYLEREAVFGADGGGSRWAHSGDLYCV